MNDALDDQQRQTVRLYLSNRLQRASDVGCARNSDTPKDKLKDKRAGTSHGERGMGGVSGSGR